MESDTSPLASSISPLKTLGFPFALSEIEMSLGSQWHLGILQDGGKKKKDVITSLVHLQKDVIKRGSKMKPCQLVRTQKVILPSALRREGDTQPYHYWHERTCWCQRCCRQKSSGVAKFINVSFWEDVMSFCCPWGWKLESTCSRQHTIILISFVLPPVCHL